MSRLGEKIKNLRIECKMSQKQLGKKLGVSESFINDVELGRKVINENLISRIEKILGKGLNDLTISFEEEVYKDEKENKYNSLPKKEEVKELWSEAFGSVLKNVPIYKYDLSKSIGWRQLPLKGNKIEGYAQDKVFFIEIQDDDMIGFRISKGDLAFAHVIHEIENNAICLVQHGDERKIRQIKKLDSNKILLIS
ncbi:helix-turn-helix transcriptional regulator, partial [Clostridium tetanomorphum]